MNDPGRRQIVRPDGATIAFDVAGDGPPVLFLHGLTSRRQAWEPVTRLLASSFTVRAVTDELGVESPAVIGNSLGANVAAVNPASAVACVGQSLLRFGDFAVLVQSYAQDLEGEGAMEAVLKIDRELGLEPLDDVDGLERRVLAFPSEVVRGVWAQLLTTPPEELSAISEALLPGIKAALLSLHGAPPPADYAPWLTRLVPTAEVEVWDDMGHLLHLVDPPRFAERLRTLLTQSD